MTTTLTVSGFSPPAAPYSYAGCHFKPVSLAIDGYDVSWPSITLERCAWECPESNYFWLESDKNCVCTQTLPALIRVNESTCDTSCSGTAAQACGSTEFLRLYTILSDVSENIAKTTKKRKSSTRTATGRGGGKRTTGSSDHTTTKTVRSGAKASHRTKTRTHMVTATAKPTHAITKKHKSSTSSSIESSETPELTHVTTKKHKSSTSSSVEMSETPTHVMTKKHKSSSSSFTETGETETSDLADLIVTVLKGGDAPNSSANPYRTTITKFPASKTTTRKSATKLGTKSKTAKPSTARSPSSKLSTVRPFTSKPLESKPTQVNTKTSNTTAVVTKARKSTLKTNVTKAPSSQAAASKRASSTKRKATKTSTAKTSTKPSNRKTTVSTSTSEATAPRVDATVVADVTPTGPVVAAGPSNAPIPSAVLLSHPTPLASGPFSEQQFGFNATFNITLYGQSSPQLVVTSNGLATVTPDRFFYSAFVDTPEPLYSGDVPPGTAFPWWHYMYGTSADHGIWYQQDGPNLVSVEWLLLDAAGSPTHFLLSYSSDAPGHVNFYYVTAGDGGACSTVGVQGLDANENELALQIGSLAAGTINAGTVLRVNTADVASPNGSFTKAPFNLDCFPPGSFPAGKCSSKDLGTKSQWNSTAHRLP